MDYPIYTTAYGNGACAVLSQPCGFQVRIKLKHMEVEIRRRETTGAGTSAHSDTETLAKYEIMDGAPVRGESIPIRCVMKISVSHIHDII